MTTGLDQQVGQYLSTITQEARRFFACFLIALASIAASLALAPAASAAPATSAKTIHYSTAPGDKLSRIARKCHASVVRTVLDNPEGIKQIIALEPPSVWVVRKDETLTLVSQCTGKSVAAIARRNSIANPHWIGTGQHLVISAPAAKSPAHTAKPRAKG
ncbi:MAG: LysM peptidoglycan-binding domain-containing protein, partial [Solirubrobacterales bacterium]|nr:LysM peptidoglycan-binding domain-containing protein [Solirubrobacterales bacterium]